MFGKELYKEKKTLFRQAASNLWYEEEVILGYRF